MNGVTHWLPQDPLESTITACGLDIDRVSIRWARSRMPWGQVPGCQVCRDRALVRLPRAEWDGADTGRAAAGQLLERGGDLVDDQQQVGPAGPHP